MAQIVSQALVERLGETGAWTPFSAAFMATGYAKATGRLGVCLATSGPGGIHLLNGLYDARLDHMPVQAAS